MTIGRSRGPVGKDDGPARKKGPQSLPTAIPRREIGAAQPVPAVSGALAQRAAAAAILAGAAVAGWWLGGRSSRFVAALVVGVTAPGVAVLSRAAGRVTHAPVTPRGNALPNDGSENLITVLIPAQDEDRHVGRLICDLGRQDLESIASPLRLRIVVIDDASRDDTAAVATRAIEDARLDGRVIGRQRPAGTKGDALRDVPPEAIGAARLLVVLDTDARIAPGFLRSVAEHHAIAGDAAFTARRRIAWANDHWLARLQDDEQALDSWILAGRTGLGGGGELRGDGMVVTPHALATAGGWPTRALTEDLELSAALLSAGIRVGWAGEVVVDETAAGTAAALARQRLRWAEGSARRFVARLPGALGARRAPLAARADLAIYAGQLVLPPLVVASVARGLAGGRRGPAVILVGGYVLTGSVLAWSAIARLQEPTRLSRRAVRALAVGAFSAHWLAALPIGLLRITFGPRIVTFQRTRARLTGDGEIQRED